MSSVFDEYQTDDDAEVNGVVQEYGEFWIKLARAGGANKDFKKVLDRKSAKYRRAIDLGKLPDHIAERILMETYAATIVKGWGGDGMVDQDGEALVLSEENVVKLFTALPDLFEDVVKDASGMDLFKKQAQREDDAGNSSGS